MKFLLRTLWAFSLILFSATFVFGQVHDYTIRQDIQGSTAQAERLISIKMVDTTDGHTPETGLSPTCTIQAPGATAFSACANAPVETGNGYYRVALSPLEWESLGYGLVNFTAAGARNGTASYKVIESGSIIKDGATINKTLSNYSNAWTLGGVTNTQNTTATYDGYTIADTLTGDGATSKHRAYYDFAKPDGAGMYFFTTEVKSGTLNNAWVGDDNYGAGVDINTSTGVATPTNSGYLRGWKVAKLASSWWRVSLIVSSGQADATGFRGTIALGNGTPAAAVPSFASSGTMIFARTFVARTDDIAPEYLEGILPNLASVTSASVMVLDANASTSSSSYVGREVCFPLGYSAHLLWKEFVPCSCVASYVGGTKTLTLTDALSLVPTTEYKYKFGGPCLKNVNAASITANAVNASALAPDAVTEIVTAIPKQRVVGR